jgi:hypothetical protein
MSWKPFITFEDFSVTMQDFNQISTIHVSYASSYLALLQCNLVEHPILEIWEDLNTQRFLQHGEYPPQVTSYHKATKWFFHHMNNLILSRRYTWSLDTLELNVFVAFSIFITIGKVCMLKSKMSLLGVNNVIEWELPSPFNSSCFLHSLFMACSITGHVT